jgi:5-methylthioadenosine/S-adenosylhomocysteine deaminase
MARQLPPGHLALTGFQSPCGADHGRAFVGAAHGKVERLGSLVVENAVLGGRKVSIHCAGGVIADIRDDGTDLPVAQRAAVDRLDGRGYLVAPGLINAHTHAAMTLFRGRADDLPLMEWLQRHIWPYEQLMTEDDVYAGARLGILEMVRNGTTFFNDMYWCSRGTVRAAVEMGIRACIGEVFIDLAADAIPGRRLEIERLLDELEGCSSRVSLSVDPHAAYTVSEDSLRWAGELAAGRGLTLPIHLAETAAEGERCLAEHACTPVAYLDRLGLLSQHTVAAHTVWLSDDDVALLGERRVVCVHNPVSNMKLAVGAVYPYRALASAGAVCAIGTDGAASNNCLDLFRDMKIAALLQKFDTNDPAALTAAETLAMATTNPAPVFELPGPEIEVGRAADFILIDGERPELSPSHSLTSDLVYSASGNIVDSVVCDGRVIMRHREIAHEREILADARQAARALFARL